MKTASQIQGDVWQLLSQSSVATAISGNVYREGYRPRDSRKEDAVVIFTTGEPGDIQQGVVTVNLYVPDVAPRSNGVYVMDGARVAVLERALQQWVDSLTADRSCYLFRLWQTIYTTEDADIHQHFIVVKLRYRFCGDDDAAITPITNH